MTVPPPPILPWRVRRGLTIPRYLMRLPACLLPSPSSALICLCIGLVWSSLAPAQEREAPILGLSGVKPSGVRDSATESWGAFDFSLTNRTDRDRQGRLLVFYLDQQ